MGRDPIRLSHLCISLTWEADPGSEKASGTMQSDAGKSQMEDAAITVPSDVHGCGCTQQKKELRELRSPHAAVV